MNEEILICYLIICFFLVLRLKYYGLVQFFHILLSIFLLISVGSIIFLVYDTWISEKLSKDQIKKILNITYKDINDITIVPIIIKFVKYSLHLLHIDFFCNISITS